MRALVTGATGFVGRHLVARLERPVVLTRDVAAARRALGPAVEAHAWDPLAGPPPAAALEGVEAVFHLAGEPVSAGRWTAAKRARILESREVATRRLVDGIARLAARPRVLVSASAVGVYASHDEAELDEAAPLADEAPPPSGRREPDSSSNPVAPSRDFLGCVCAAWEREAARAASAGVRVAILRIGIVLGAGGGALSRVLPLFRLGLGGRITLAGRQWWPWVHVDDVTGLALFAAREASVEGPLNAVAPEPVRNRDFTSALARVLGRPAFFHAPALALRLGLGGFASVLTDSKRAVPRAALRAGYRFAFPALEGALRAAIESERLELAPAGAP